jgi:hypothetical protein
MLVNAKDVQPQAQLPSTGRALITASVSRYLMEKEAGWGVSTLVESFSTTGEEPVIYSQLIYKCIAAQKIGRKLRSLGAVEEVRRG